MEFTGYYYSFYFDSQIEQVIEKLKTINYLCEVSTSSNGTDYFYYQDELMYRHHLETGYNIDRNGEGCFCLETQSTTLNSQAYLVGYEHLPTQFILKHINYIFLILPEDMENSIFCKKIYDLIVSAL